MSNITIFSDLFVKDKTQFSEFAMAHAMSHEAIYDTILQAGTTIPHFPYFDVVDWDKDWLQNHQQEHQAIYNYLGVTGLPDLASSDLTKDEELQTWMQLHADVHDYINQLLNL
jgi:hypothetical protein